MDRGVEKGGEGKTTEAGKEEAIDRRTWKE